MYSVTNEGFLQACFGPDWQAAHVTAVAGDPTEPTADWFGNRFGRCRHTAAFPALNTYFAISLFEDDPDTGRALRRKALHRATHVIVVDDVGTRVDPAMQARLPAPSWKLETSPGNFQWGYILATPETDAPRVDALLGGMVAAGLCSDGKDPGMKGVTRYVRLPEGRNHKAAYGPGGFQCVMHEWNPNVVVQIEDLATPFSIFLPAPGTSSSGVGRLNIPQSKDDLFGHLVGWGLVTGSRTTDGAGFKCVCPWAGEHTVGDDGAAYWLGGGFKCWHGHCEGRGRRELWAYAEERLRDESGGLAGIAPWNFDVVPTYRPPGARQATIAPPGVGTGTRTGTGTGTGMGTRTFFGDLIFVRSEDRFFSLASGELLTRGAVDVSWTRELTAELPVTNARTGELMPASKWFAHPDNRARARIADKLAYWPGAGRYFEDGGLHYANKWVAVGRLGLAVTDADVEPWLRLVRHIVGSEGPDAVEHGLDWLALVVGAPGLKPGWHLVLQGPQGLGKDMMLRPVIVGVGEDNVGTVNAVALHGAFNAYAERRLVIVNELKQTSRGTATGADQYAVLKELTENTNTRIKVNSKYVREYYARNVSAFCVTSNDEQAIALEADDRRFAVVMATVRPWPKAEYQALAEWMRDGGAELAAEWLRDRWDAMGQDRRDALLGPAPGTAGKARMIANTEDPVVAWMREQIETGAWPDLMTSRDISAAVAGAAKLGTGGFNFAPSPSRWGAALRRLGGAKVYGGEPVQLKSGERARVWAVRGAERFDAMGASQLAQAYVSAAGHAFADNNDVGVISISAVKDPATDGTPPKSEV